MEISDGNEGTTARNSLPPAFWKLWRGWGSRIGARPIINPEGNGYIERFHSRLKEEEVRLAEYRNLEETRESIARYLREYNHYRPHRGPRGRTALGGIFEL